MEHGNIKHAVRINIIQLASHKPAQNTLLTRAL